MPSGMRIERSAGQQSVSPQLWHGAFAGASLAPALPVVTGTARFRHLPREWRALYAWLWLSLLISVGMMAMALMGTQNASLAHLLLPVYCVLGLGSFGELAERRGYRSVVRAAAILYVMAWGLVTIVDGVPADYSRYAQPLMDLIFVAAATGLIVVRLGQVWTDPLRDPVVLVGLGVLVTYAPSVAIYPVAAVVGQSNPELALILYLVRAGFLILGTILFTLALLWTPQHPSSFGF